MKGEARPENLSGGQISAPNGRSPGLGVPVAEGGMLDEALADGGPAGGLDAVGLQARLVDEHQLFQHVGHVRLEDFDPGLASLGHLGAQDFAGQQRFFYG